MSLALCFWIIILILILFFGAFWGGLLHPTYLGINNLVELALFILLGWQVFGPPLRRGS
jgi:hypothetical protein